MTGPESDLDDREARRRKLFGRLVVIGFGVLLLIYIAATFIR